MASPRIIAYPGLGTTAGGRLANQLWQVAGTVGIARKRNWQPLFPENWKYRPYYSCPKSWFGSIQPNMATAPAMATRLDRRARPYLQDLSLWTNVVSEIRTAFQPSESALEVVEAEWGCCIDKLPRPICAVHVRRGDYVTNPDGTLTALPAEWYKEAIKSVDHASVVVFSDDIRWCRTVFDDEYTYYEGVPRVVEQHPKYQTDAVLDWVDIFLMARCDSFVISNSTYGWWGAWLANTNNVVYPSRWYGKTIASYTDFRKMIPSGWSELSV